jgi:hypothetical protein
MEVRHLTYGAAPEAALQRGRSARRKVGSKRTLLVGAGWHSRSGAGAMKV